MAQKRMFDCSIIKTDDFMDLPMSAKALYFLLGMEADDEGFVSPKMVMRMYGGGEDDLKILIAKKYVIKFETGVVVIIDWHENNWLDRRRIKETRYKAEKELLAKSDNKYMLLSERSATAKQPLREYSIEENRIEENSIEENRPAEQSSDDIKQIMDIFYQTNPTLNWGNKTYRKSASELVERFGIKRACEFAAAAVACQGKKFAPIITNPYQLKEKLTSLKAFYDREKSESPRVVTV